MIRKSINLRNTFSIDPSSVFKENEKKENKC